MGDATIGKAGKRLKRPQNRLIATRKPKIAWVTLCVFAQAKSIFEQQKQASDARFAELSSQKAELEEKQANQQFALAEKEREIVRLRTTKDSTHSQEIADQAQRLIRLRDGKVIEDRQV